jgi:hypothetical protein
MYLGRLRDIAAKELKTGVSDVVIAIPGWYTDMQRRALLSAAAIAGLNTLRLIPGHTALAFGYGITKSDLADAENPRRVVFLWTSVTRACPSLLSPFLRDSRPSKALHTIRIWCRCRLRRGSESVRPRGSRDEEGDGGTDGGVIIATSCGQRFRAMKPDSHTSLQLRGNLYFLHGLML